MPRESYLERVQAEDAAELNEARAEIARLRAVAEDVAEAWEAGAGLRILSRRLDALCAILRSSGETP